MVHPFVKAYKSVCKELLTPLGFKCRGRYFYRIVNDVYQELALQRYSDGVGYTVRFAFTPLCCGIKIIDELFAWFALALFEPLPSCEYDETEEDYQKTATRLGKMITKYIVPIFERTTNTTAAFTEWNNLSYKTWSKSSLRNPHYIVEQQIWMAISLGEYEFAVEGLLQRIELSKRGFNQGNGEEFKRKVKLFEEIIEHIQANDLLYLQNLISENERISRITLKIPLIGEQ